MNTATNPTGSGLAGRTALVTGAAGDIGAAVAASLAGSGVRLVLADIGGDLERSASRCRQASEGGIEPVMVRFDVTDEGSVAETIGALSQDGVVADLLFNNAGYQGDFANVAEYDGADFRQVLDVNVTGVFIVLQQWARTLIDTGQPGAAVNTASMAQTGAPNMAAYSASKAAVVALTKTAAKDLAHHGIRVNSVSPAFIGPGQMWDRQVELQAQTPSEYYADDPATVAEQMLGAVPLRRYGSLDEVASVVRFLLSDDASYVTGFDAHVSGGIA